MRARGRERGLSLVELLLGLAITALVMLPLLPMLQLASAASGARADQAALARDADFALNRIAARIRSTAPAPLLAGKDSSEWLKPAIYSFSGGTLIEQIGADKYVLAESVTSFSLTAPSTVGKTPVVIASLALARNGANASASVAVRMGSEP